MHVSAFLVVYLVATLTFFKVIIKFIWFLTICTNLCCQFLKCTFETQFIILSDLSFFIKFLLNLFLIVFSLFFFERRASTLVCLACTPFYSTIIRRTIWMLIANSSATVIFHTNWAIKYDITIPIMIVADILFNWRLVSVCNFLNLEKILYLRRFLFKFEFYDRRFKYLI